MNDKIIIDRMDAEEFLSMLVDAAKQDNPTRYFGSFLMAHRDISEINLPPVSKTSVSKS